MSMRFPFLRLGSFAFIFVLFRSCQVTSNEQLISGKWLPFHPAAIHSNALSINFLPPHLCVVEMHDQIPKATDTLSYGFTKNGRTLLFKERTGNTDSFEVLALTAEELMLYSNKNGDTMHYIKFKPQL